MEHCWDMHVARFRAFWLGWLSGRISGIRHFPEIFRNINFLSLYWDLIILLLLDWQSGYFFPSHFINLNLNKCFRKIHEVSGNWYQDYHPESCNEIKLYYVTQKYLYTIFQVSSRIMLFWIYQENKKNNHKALSTLFMTGWIWQIWWKTLYLGQSICRGSWFTKYKTTD